MIDKFWHDCCVRRKNNTWSNEIGDVCVDILDEIIKERERKDLPHFSQGLGTEKFPHFSRCRTCSFNDYFVGKNISNFVSTPMKQRVVNIQKLFKEDKFEEANKVFNSLKQRMDVVYKILPHLMPDGNFGLLERIQDSIIPDMRKALKAKLSAITNVSRTTSSTNVNAINKRTLSNADFTENDTNVKKPRTKKKKKKKKKKKPRMMMMSATDSDEKDTSEDDVEDDTPTPILVDDGGGGNTPILVNNGNADHNTPILVNYDGGGGNTPILVNTGNADHTTPILVNYDNGGNTPVSMNNENADYNTPILMTYDDGGITPVLVNNGNAGNNTPILVNYDGGGGNTPILVNTGNADHNTPILVNFDDGGNTPVLVNNGNADNNTGESSNNNNNDVMELLQSAAKSTVCCNKNQVAENLPEPKPLSDALIKALVGEKNMNGRNFRRSYRHTNNCFVTRRLKLILPKNWLEEVKPPPLTMFKKEGSSVHQKDLWVTDYERYWNSGNFILRRPNPKDDSPNTPFFVARKLVNGTWQHEPETQFDLCLGSTSTNKSLSNSNKNPGIQIKNFTYEDSSGKVIEDEDKIEITLDMYDITKLGDCTAKNNDVCDDCYHKLNDSDAFIFNYGAPLRFVLICRKPQDTYTDKTKNFNHRENIYYKYFPMVEFKINYGAMDHFQSSTINNYSCCMQIREQKHKDWALTQYDAVNFRFDVNQWGDTDIGNVSEKTIGEVTFELECDIVTKSTLLKKLGTERTSSRAKTGLLKKHISVQKRCRQLRCNGYEKYNDEECRWFCERCTCKCGGVLVESLHMEPYQNNRISEKLRKTQGIWLCKNNHCDIVYDRRLVFYECKNTFRGGIKCKGSINESGQCDFCTCRDCQSKMELDAQSNTLWRCSADNCNYAVETHEDKESVTGVLRYYFVK